MTGTALVTGGSGALGTQLKGRFPDALAPSHAELDVSDRAAVLSYFEGHPEIDTVIHGGALTGIRPCEEDRPLAWRTNVVGTRNLVEAATLRSRNKAPVRFCYVSTACVFDGHTGMYDEDSVPYPENFYALTKLVGEHEALRLPDPLIVRTNFVARERWPHPKAFTDRFGTYLFADGVAEGISDVLADGMTGTVHVVGDRKMSVFELARMTTPGVQPMTIDDYSGPRLTMDMSLDTKRWKKYSIGG